MQAQLHLAHAFEQTPLKQFYFLFHCFYVFSGSKCLYAVRFVFRFVYLIHLFWWLLVFNKKILNQEIPLFHCMIIFK